ncbi:MULTISPECIES: O-acetylhomoserine aminocarboxypropyltransferase [unclassified Undibacterium]|uniref:O-acetylhomoserine aminocarboxypropyltransferase n=1 Tax=unclassified Undibacterium TaxID=2630295 RepID=UPI002AC8DE57|nr:MULTISPECIES: O-acetylhomoserine aminocarboxypropyltransferase [unclassified Undibacterium]MEB0139151.1 O-acetylhomoserine aminocarboxypropyltransferase [Undibacterium sp. CCC2.1]MEB0172869.1 O-acetylhomoserine aminocarboxypropyltransferase [Undibacterium sp. CCC1.1]MEB0176659.1 O-acetylhomoserine aminocarboxypropyltransferase [Undibacterium sp. CCC3.4]MEB0216013.1 O-acetylhomoserine aminocarboxypropyltransferase [Undibacterium sp. 5I2]WPX43145.1 O-acetylhomoserine aminocarboxypropyltransfe
MSGPHYPGFDTLALHAGATPDPATGARATPIYLSSSFVFNDTDHAAALFNMERAGHVYSRISNPTNAVLEERIAALEGGVAGIAVASGQAALHLAIATIAGCGSHIVASRAIYGGSQNLLAYTMKRFGIETSFVDPRDLDAWRGAIRPNTKALFAETLGNPGLDVLNIAAVSELAHEHYLPLLLDATFTTPYLLRPFEHGADLICHSATKFLCGHGTAIGGLLVDGGVFDWQQAYAQSGRFEELCAPYDGFHGMVFAEESSVAPFALRARREGLRDFGACMSPHNAFAILQGIETLGLRMDRHVANTRKVVEFLLSHPAVASIAYPELASHPDYELAKTLLPKGAGAVFSFNLKGDRAAGRRFVEALQLFSHLANVGDAKSLVIHPASTTHFRVPAEQLAASGISEGTMRLSIGLEDPDDLIEDLARGLKAAMKGA